MGVEKGEHETKRPGMGLLILASGFLFSFMFCFLVYPRIDAAHMLKLDPDGYGALGEHVTKGQGFVFRTPNGPTVYRGPLYPWFIAAVYKATSGKYSDPRGLWVAQSFLMGLTCLLVWMSVARIWGRKMAAAAGFACVFYPAIFWYVPRMWHGILVMTLLSGLVYISIRAFKKNGYLNFIAMGIILGLLCLCKAVFLPLIILLPVGLWFFAKFQKAWPAVTMILVAILVVVPWTVRNYRLTGKIIPVHTGAGFNMKLGNLITEKYLTHPFSYESLFWEARERIDTLVGDVTPPRFMVDLERERILMASALKDLRSDPLLVVKKSLAAGAMFWYIADSFPKTMVLLALRLPVLFLAVLGIVRVIRSREKVWWPAILIILTYWLSHLPFAPPARLSVPILPLMVIFALYGLLGLRRHPS